MMNKRFQIPPYTSISNIVCITQQQSSINGPNIQNLCPNIQYQRRNFKHQPSNQQYSLAIELDQLHQFGVSTSISKYPLANTNQRKSFRQRSFQIKENQENYEKQNRNKKYQQTFQLSKNKQFSFLSPNWRWEFDLALNEQISQRIQSSINNESKVIAFHEVYLQDVASRVFNQWKWVVKTKKQLNQEDGYFISNKQQIREYNERKQNIVERKQEQNGEIRAQSFYLRRKYKYLLHWKDRLHTQQNQLRNMEYNRIQLRKLTTLKRLSSNLRRSKLTAQAGAFREKTLVSKTYFSFCKFIQSKILVAHLNQIGEISYRKTLLSKAFYALLQKRREYVLELKANQLIKSRLQRYLNYLNNQRIYQQSQVQILQRKREQKQRIFFNKLKKLNCLYQSEMEMKWFIFKKRFDEFTKLTSLKFSNDLLLYSVNKYYEDVLFKKYFKLLKQKQHRPVPTLLRPKERRES